MESCYRLLLVILNEYPIGFRFNWAWDLMVVKGYLRGRVVIKLQDYIELKMKMKKKIKNKISELYFPFEIGSNN